MRRTLLVLLVTVLAGCGSSGGASTASTTPTVAIDAKADQALADNLVATRDDVPSGWTEEADEAPDSGCFTKPLGQPTTPSGAAHGKSVQSEGFGFIHSYSRVYPTDGDATTAFAAASAPAQFTCQLETAKTRAAAATDPKLKSGTIRKLDATGVGDQAAAYQVELQYEGTDASPYSAFGDWWVIRRGRAVVVMVFAELGQPFDDTIRTDTLEKVLTRLPTGV